MSVCVSIVIRCYNEEQHVGRLLSGIMQQTVQDVEVVIVDSGSTDATVSVASRYPVKVVLIAPDEFSFGRSLNLGCREAKGEFVVVASAHAYPVNKDWLEKLLAPFSDPQVALVYGKQRGDETTKYSERTIFARWFPDISDLRQDHPFCNNANAAIRRSAWQQLPYDETLTGLEDLDWANRAMALGHSIAYTAEAEIVHVHNETPEHICNRYRREAIAMKHIFPQERFTLWDFARLLVANVVSDCYRAYQDKVLWANLSSILVFRTMQFWGTFRGYGQRHLVSDQLRNMFYYPNGLARAESVMTRIAPGNRVEYAQVAGEGEMHQDAG